jgi:D-3-phosphoglycerate dehydrogenase
MTDSKPSPWKILLTDGLHPDGQELLRQSAQVDDRRGIEAEELLEIIGAYDAVIVRSRTRLDTALLAQAHRLKVVGRAGVGVDNIDLTAAATCGITVVNTPHANSLATAEHTLGLMLALARSIPQADTAMKSGRWDKDGLVGVELSGKTLGILGVGRTGGLVALRAEALGMTVLGYDPLLSDDQIQQGGAQPVALAELYRRADFISLHLPLSPGTRRLVDGQAASSMKPPYWARWRADRWPAPRWMCLPRSRPA